MITVEKPNLTEGFPILTFFSCYALLGSLYVGSYHNSENTAYKEASCQIAVYFYG